MPAYPRGLHNIDKKVKVIGVEVEDSACFLEAVKANKRVTLKEVGLFADGVAVAQIGKNNFDVVKECVDEVITVSVDEVCAAVKDIFEDTRVLSEPAGALTLAGLKVYYKKNKKVKILITGCVGFLGFHACNYLTSKGFQIIGIDNVNTYYDIKLKHDRLKILKRKKFYFL